LIETLFWIGRKNVENGLTWENVSNVNMSDKKEPTLAELLKRIEDLEKDLDTLKQVHDLPTHFQERRLVNKNYNGSYSLEGGGFVWPPSSRQLYPGKWRSYP